MSVWSDLSTLFSRVISVFSTYDWVSDTLDILLLTVLVYSLLKVIRDSRALTLAKGLVIFIVAYVIVLLLDMKSCSSCSTRAMNTGNTKAWDSSPGPSCPWRGPSPRN